MCATRWRTSACRRFPCSSCKVRRSQRRLEEGQGRSNCQTLFGLDQIPSDNHIRALLDPVSPDHFHPVFAEVVTELERSGDLEAFRQLGGHVLIALDGTEYHVSGKVHCQHCSTRKRGQDKIEHFHALVSATVVAPEHNRVVPLELEFIVPQDGHDKQDCESGAWRWLWPAPRPAEADLSGRRPVLPSADLRGGAGGGWALPVRVQAVVPPDDRGISYRRRAADPDPQ